MEVKTRIAFPCPIFEISRYTPTIHLPRLDQGLNVGMLVYPTIVHHDHWVRCRIWLHIVKKSFDELSKCFGTEGAFNHVTVKNPTIQWYSGEHRKAYINQKRASKDNVGVYRRPRTKKALRCALAPRMDHARPRYVVRRSTELSSTKMSWLASYLLILDT